MDRIIDSGMKMHDFIKALFERADVAGVAALMPIPNSGKVTYTLVTDTDHIENITPFFPVMPVNAGRAVSKLTRESSPSETVAVFLRPCELRALIELAKIKQASLDNLLLISFDCGGVFPSSQISMDDEEGLNTYQNALKEGTICPDIRPVCSGCDQFMPHGADLGISLIGRGMDTSLALYFLSEKGKQITETLGLGSASEIQPGTQTESLMSERKKAKEELTGKMGAMISNTEGLLEVFDRCISCHACSYVCPICYCKNCYFESQTFKYFPESYFNRMKQKETLRLPLDRILFHLGRLSHMATSCVACGMCEDVCPVDIPVAQIFKTAGEKAQALFNYMPGQNFDEPFPLTTFQEEELETMED